MRRQLDPLVAALGQLVEAIDAAAPVAGGATGGGLLQTRGRDPGPTASGAVGLAGTVQRFGDLVQRIRSAARIM